MSDRNSVSAYAARWPAAAVAWIASRARVLLPATLVTLFLSSEPLFQQGLFDLWSPADVLVAWLEYLVELGGIAAAMVAAYWFVDDATERWPGLLRYRLLLMAAAFHVVAFAGVLALTIVFSGEALPPPSELVLTQASRWALLGTLGTGVDGAVNALAMDGNGNLYAGGTFSTAGSISASRVAKWDGSSWSALGSGVNNVVGDLAINLDGNLCAVGSFVIAGGKPSSRFALWRVAPTAVTFNDVIVEAGHGYVDLHCSVSLDSMARLFVLRSTSEDGPYQPISGGFAATPGRSDFAFRDSSVEPSAAYYYKIGCSEGRAWSYSSPIRVVTAAGTLALMGANPNPSSGVVNVPDDEPGLVAVESHREAELVEQR